MPLGAPVRERLAPTEALLARAIEFGEQDAEDDLAWALARERLLAAARRYGRAQQAEGAAPILSAAGGTVDV